MTEGKPYLPWPGADDRTVVEEMLRDDSSGQWYECREFVKKCVYKQAKNICTDHWDDIVQETMIRVKKSLHTFKYVCKLRTWLFGIIRNCIIDAHRKNSRAGQFVASPGEYQNDDEHEVEAFYMNSMISVEDQCIILDDLKEALAALLEYVSTHANTARNKQILDMVIFNGYSLEEAVRSAGCSAPVAGYVVRSAQRYVREKLGFQR